MFNRIFIPEKVEIQRGYSFFAKEFVFKTKEDISLLIEKREAKKTEKLFSNTNKIKLSKLFNFETDWISIPSNFEKH